MDSAILCASHVVVLKKNQLSNISAATTKSRHIKCSDSSWRLECRKFYPLRKGVITVKYGQKALKERCPYRVANKILSDNQNSRCLI